MDANARPEVSIIVISYNTREMTLAALRSAEAETHAAHEFIVVDNASTDGSPEAIGQLSGNVRLRALAGNIGFGRANNVAAAEARGEYLLLLNPDTVVLDGAIDRLLAFAKAEPQAEIWGGRTLFPDLSLNPSSCWQRMTIWSLACRASGLAAVFRRSTLFNPEALGGWQRDSVRNVDIVSGCFLLIRAETWRRLGGFDPTFFMYGEEADLCLRAKAAGARPMVTPDATIVHYGGASEKARSDKLVKLLAAKATLIERHMVPRARPLGRMLLAAWPLSRFTALTTAARLTRSGRYAEAAAVWRAVWQRRREWSAGYAPAHAALAPAPRRRDTGAYAAPTAIGNPQEDAA